MAIAEFLLEKYGDQLIHEKDNVCEECSLECLLLSISQNGSTSLHWACGERVELAEVLLQHGADPYVKNMVRIRTLH